jgi:hypothetical protein
MIRRMLTMTTLLLACATTPASPGGATEVQYPGTFLPASSIGPDFQWQQRVTAHWHGRKRGFDAVLSKTEDELLLVALGPMKTPGFFVRLSEGVVGFENRTPHELPFDPRYMILDVQRVYYPWIPGAPPKTGERTHRHAGERIHEVWRDGRLLERRFVREDEQPPGEITVHYEGWEDGLDAPGRAILDNGWLGYALVIETLVQERL